MKMVEFLKTWEGTKAENRTMRLYLVLMLVLLIILSGMVFTKDTIVVIQPETLTDESWASKSEGSKSYIEGWALFFAQLSGNVTPDTIGFIEQKIKPYLAPAAYQDTINAINVQAQQFIEDRVTMRFEPRFVEYEQTTGKVFVYGFSFVRGATSEELRNEITYEYEISIAKYLPVVHYIQVYSGKPRNERVLSQMERKAASIEARKAKEGK